MLDGPHGYCISDESKNREREKTSRDMILKGQRKGGAHGKKNDRGWRARVELFRAWGTSLSSRKTQRLFSDDF
jgi:hypothetical protein